MNGKSGLIEKDSFLESSSTLILGFVELASKRIVENTLRIGIIELQYLPPDLKKILKVHKANSICSKSEAFFDNFLNHLDESYVTVSYSWLESYLSLVEEVLYLNDPRSLGDNIQIKLGKILETESITKLIHDAIKKRLKEKSSWGLKNRINDLKDSYSINFETKDQALDFLSNTRNELVHNKKYGDFTVIGGKISYEHRHNVSKPIIAKEYLDGVLGLIVELFFVTSKKLEIDNRNKKFKQIAILCNGIKDVFKES